MTTVKLIKKGDSAIGFDVSGHSGYAENGSDIICAAVSSAVNFAETLINDSFGADAKVEVEPETARIKLVLSNEDKACRKVLEAFERHMRAVAFEYPEYIEIMEVQSNA
ncbi:MAG: ribosomal-processing cysteine protease Prp [Oscillospiraceae bacterium]|nr:ribosomal-processing cysteine protease Prp [Oscillospiraceae bacterium]MBQ7054776.1 ribosomal-processing cysteine protease Prp [Oscillospiraceae bacterium]